MVLAAFDRFLVHFFLLAIVDRAHATHAIRIAKTIRIDRNESSTPSQLTVYQIYSVVEISDIVCWMQRTSWHSGWLLFESYAPTTARASQDIFSW